MKTASLRRRDAVVLLTVLLVSVGVSTSAIVSVQDARAQTNANMTGSMTGGSNQNQTTNMMMGPNITGSVPLGPTIAKAIASQVHVSLANASAIAEKAVGANAHAAAVRIGVVHGFLVYMALVIDSNYGFHGVLVDAGNGKVLSSAQMSMAAMMGPSMGMMMGPSMGMMMGPSMGMMMGPSMGMMMGPSMGMMMGPSMGMMQHGMVKGPGMIKGHP
jgi:hypothetical protein